LNPLSAIVLDHEEYCRWNNFVRTAVNGTIYSETIWGEALNKIDPLLKYDVIAVKKGEEFLGGILIFIKRKKVIIPQFTPYESVIYRRVDERRNYELISERREINEAIADYLRKNYFRISVKQNHEYIDIRDFQFKGFESSFSYTYVNDLTSYDIEQVNRKARREITKASEQNYSFEEVRDFTEFDLRRLLLPFFETMNRKVFRIDEDFKRRFIEMLKAIQGRAVLYVLSEADNILSVRVELIDNDEKVEDWIAGTTMDGREKRITSYFVHRILLDLKQKGYKYFDWNGANTPGVTDFKNNFNGRLKPYAKIDGWKNKCYELTYKTAVASYKSIKLFFAR